MTDLNGIFAQGGMKLLGIIGDPVAHSLSPALFSFLLRELGTGEGFQYRAWRVRPEAMGAFLARIRESATVGLNVTIPHKETVVTFLDGLDATAQVLEAVNTVKETSGQLIGYNTDWLGFLRSLQAREVVIAGRTAVVLGAGGAAKAVVYALIREGIARLTIYNRTATRAETLAQEMRRKMGFAPICAVCPEDGEDVLAETLQEASLLVNTTSVGMYPRVNESPLPDPSVLHAGLIVYDSIYNPLQTRFMQQAERRGALVLGGLDMLIYQALESLRIWLGQAGLPWVARAEALLPELRQRLTEQLRSGAERGR